MHSTRALIIIVVAAAVVMLAWCALCRAKKGEGGEGFSENTVMTATGDLVIDNACQVRAAGGGTYVMHGFPHLERHPTLNGSACVVRQSDDQPAIMDAALQQCSAAGAPHLADVTAVRDIAPANLGGVNACVVSFNTGLQEGTYQAYEQGARDRTVMRTKEYSELQAAHNALRDGQDAELDRSIARLRTEVAEAQRQLDARDVEHAEASGQLQQMQQELNGRMATIQQLTALIAEAEPRLAGVVRDTGAAEGRVTAAQATTADLARQIAAQNAAISNGTSEEARLVQELAATNRAIADATVEVQTRTNELASIRARVARLPPI